MHKALRLLPLLFLAATPALAHDWVKPDGTKVSATWIMKDPNTSWCCGPQDCEPVPGRVAFTGAGWTVRGIKGTVPINRTFRSIDGQPWACRHVSTNAIRCLFLPDTRN